MNQQKDDNKKISFTGHTDKIFLSFHIYIEC